MSENSISPSSPKPPFYAFTHAADSEALREFTEAHSWAADCVKQGDIATAAAFLKQNPSPEFLLVEIASAESAPQALEQLAEVCDPDTKVAIAGTVNEYSFYCWLMDIGISSYLLKPLNVKMLEAAWAKATRAAPAAAAQTRTDGKLIGVLGTHGGVGATTIAVCLGALAAAAGKKTALVDLDPQDGSIALMLDLDPSRGFREALERPDRIDNLFLERACNRLSPNFHILSAEESLADAVQYHERAADTLLKELRETYDIVILDIPLASHGFFRATLSACDKVFAVTDLTLPGLSAGIRINELFKDHLKRPAPVFVANRVGLAAKYEIPAAEYGKGVGAKLEHTIPFAPEAFMTLSGELKLLKNPALPATKALLRLSALIAPVPEKKDEKEKAGGLAGLLKKGKHTKAT